MKIVRISRGPRLFAASAVLFSLSVFPARPAAATTAFAGECSVIATSSYTSSGTLGGASLELSVASTSCVFAGTTNPGQAGAWMRVTLPVGTTCVAGEYQGNGRVSFPARTANGEAVVSHSSAEITFTVLSAIASAVGELTPYSVNATGCPTSWRGVMVVEDPEVS